MSRSECNEQVKAQCVVPSCKDFITFMVSEKIPMLTLVGRGSKPCYSLTVGELLTQTFHTDDSVFILLTMWESYSPRHFIQTIRCLSCSASGRVTRPDISYGRFGVYLTHHVEELLTQRKSRNASGTVFDYDIGNKTLTNKTKNSPTKHSPTEHSSTKQHTH